MDFMFQLTKEEWESLKSQFVIAKTGRGGSRSLPYAFTEHGVLMLASVLHGSIAAQASINISRTFAEMRRYIVSSAHFTSEMAELRAKIELLVLCQFKPVNHLQHQDLELVLSVRMKINKSESVTFLQSLRN